MKQKPAVATIGHSNRNIKEFLALLQSAGVERVIDCRTKPFSRWRQYNQDALEKHLRDIGIAYEWRGTNIGGYPGNVFYDATLDELANRAKDGERMALLCSEGNPADCHRGTDLAPELEERSVRVEHLRYDAKR